MRRLSDGHVSDAEIALYEGYAPSRCADVLCLRVGLLRAHADLWLAHDARCEAVVERLGMSRWLKARSVPRAMAP